MFTQKDPVALPRPSQADRKVAKSSPNHCTAYAVLGSNEGVVMQGESHLELCHLYLLNDMSNVLHLKEQALFLYGWDVSRPARHYFDILDNGYRIAFAVKPEVRLTSGRVHREMSEIAWWVEEFNFADEVRLLTGIDIDEIDLRNAQYLAAVREPDPEADAAAFKALCALPEGAGQSIRDLTVAIGMKDRGYRAAIRLIRNGFARPLRREKLGHQSLIVRITEEDRKRGVTRARKLQPRLAVSSPI